MDRERMRRDLGGGAEAVGGYSGHPRCKGPMKWERPSDARLRGRKGTGKAQENGKRPSPRADGTAEEPQQPNKKEKCYHVEHSHCAGGAPACL